MYILLLDYKCGFQSNSTEKSEYFVLSEFVAKISTVCTIQTSLHLQLLIND